MKVKDKDITKYDVVKLNIDSIKSRVNNPFARVEKVLSYLGDEEKENYQIYTKTLNIYLSKDSEFDNNGLYTSNNMILLNNENIFDTLTHELFHLSSQNGLANKDENDYFDESTTEYFAMITSDNKDNFNDYCYIGLIVISSLVNILGIEHFKYYFKGDREGFINSYGDYKDNISKIMALVNELLVYAYDKDDEALVIMSKMKELTLGIIDELLDIASSLLDSNKYIEYINYLVRMFNKDNTEISDFIYRDYFVNYIKDNSNKHPVRR